MVIITLVFLFGAMLYELFVLSLIMVSFADDGYETDGDLTDVDDTPDESFYGPKVPRSRRALKKDDAIVDTNFLA